MLILILFNITQDGEPGVAAEPVKVFRFDKFIEHLFHLFQCSCCNW